MGVVSLLHNDKKTKHFPDVAERNETLYFSAAWTKVEHSAATGLRVARAGERNSCDCEETEEKKDVTEGTVWQVRCQPFVMRGA